MNDKALQLDSAAFSGCLTNPDGTNPPDGSYDIQLNIFTEPSGGKAIWSQTMNSVSVRNGMFTVQVEKKSLPAADIIKGEAYLEIQVGKEVAGTREKLDSASFDPPGTFAPAQPIISDVATSSFASNIVPDQGIPSKDQLIVSPVVGRILVGPESVPSGIAQSGGYVYVISSESRRFHVIDVRDPIRPVLAGSSWLPPVQGFTVVAKKVLVSGQYAYVLDWNPNVGETGIVIVDVAIPSNPYVIGKFATSSGWDLAISGDLAFTWDQEGLVVLALEKGVNPVVVGRLSQAVPYLVEYQAVAMTGNYALVVADDLRGTDPSMGESPELHPGVLLMIDISKPTQPKMANTTAIPRGSHFIRVLGRYAYVLSGTVSCQNSKVQILDIANPGGPITIGEWLIPLGSPLSLGLSGQYIYTLEKDLDWFQRADISDPTNPTTANPIEIFEFQDEEYRGTISEGLAYVVNMRHDPIMRVIRLT